MNTPTAIATLLANGPYERDDAPFRLLEVRGPDAGEFLHRLCSQAIVGLDEGPAVPAAFLDGKGKVLATALVFRDGDGFWLEVQATQADKLAALLERYHFSETLTLTAHAQAPCRERIEVVTGDGQCAAERDGDGHRVQFARRGVQFVRWHGAAAGDDTAKPLSHELAECLRMASGMVRVDVETEAATLALEADLDDHCSTTKGCYTGQEIVARIRTYGKVNRKLCLLQLAAGAAIDAPATLLEPEDELPVGRVMHALSTPANDLRVGLGYLPADFQAVGTKLQLEGGGAVEVIGF